MNMEKEEISVIVSDVDFNWGINDITTLKVHFKVLTQKPKFDPFEVSEFLAKQFEEFLKDKSK